MSRTFRTDNGLNKGRDDKPHGSKCEYDTHHPKGYNTFKDDHGYYGAGGSRHMKKMASVARRTYFKNFDRNMEL